MLFEFFGLGARLFDQCFVLFGFGVEADVEFHQFVALALLDRLAVAPLAVGDDHFPKLGAPVSEVVDPDAVVTRELMQQFQRVTDDGGAEMPDVEGFGDVRGGIVENDGLTRPAGGRAVLVALLLDLGEDARGERRAVDKEVQVTLDRLGARDLVARHFRSERVGDGDGGGVQGARQFEARERKVAHRGVGREFEHTRKIVRRERRTRVEFGNQIRQFRGGLPFQGDHILFSILI